MCTVNHCDYDPQSLFYIFQKYTCWLAVILTLRPQNISKIWIWPGTFVTSLSLISCYPLLLCNKDTPPQKKTNKKNKTSPVSLRWSNSPFFQVHIAISCDRKIFGVIILQEKWPFWQCWMLLISEGYSFSDTHHIGREIAFFSYFCQVVVLSDSVLSIQPTTFLYCFFKYTVGICWHSGQSQAHWG